MIGLCLLLFIPSCHGFGGIRSLLSTKAVVVSLLDEISSELLDRPLAIRELGIIMNHHIDYFYIGCVVSSMSYFVFHRVPLDSSFMKLNHLSVYRNTYYYFRIFLFTMFLLFTRDVENAI